MVRVGVENHIHSPIVDVILIIAYNEILNHDDAAPVIGNSFAPVCYFLAA